MKIFGEKDVLLMTELKIDTMSQNETTKLDIIVEVLGEREPEIRRLVISVSYTHLRAHET